VATSCRGQHADLAADTAEPARSGTAESQFRYAGPDITEDKRVEEELKLLTTALEQRIVERTSNLAASQTAPTT